MDFNLKERAATFARAMKPNDIRAETKNWTKLESYVYVISKRMSVKADDGDAINLVKVGMSNLTTKEKTGKGYARLLSFRTSLLSFLVHRIYLFDDSDIDPSQDPDQPFGLNAYLAEQLLHFQIDDKFPQAKRIKFANGLPSEWFHVPDKHMPAFTKFLDTKIQLDSPIAPAYGTAFSRDSFKRIQFPERKQGVGVEIVGGRAQRRKVYRITQNRYARNARVRNTQIEIEYKKNEAKELNAKERKALAKSVDFWEKVLVGKTFTDKKMYGGDKGLFGGKRKITNVFKDPGKQILVAYEPDLTKSQDARATQKDIDASSGQLTIHEALRYFDDLKRKYQDSYDYYANLNSFEEGYDYEEDYQEEPEVVVAETQRGRRRRSGRRAKPTFTNVPKAAKGRWVRKQFGKKYFLGRIESVGTASGRESGKGDVETGQQFARVKFLDGDKEDIDAQELKWILLSPTEERFYLNAEADGVRLAQ